MKLPCYLIQELLPLYHDNVLGEQAAADVREHLDTCADCRAVLAALDADTGAEAPLQTERQRAAADALRKVRRTIRKRQWVPAVVVGLAIVLVLVVLSRVRYQLQTESRILQPEEIASVEVRQPVYVDIQLNNGCYSDSVSWRILEIPDGDETKTALVFSMYVSRWNEITHNGKSDWQINSDLELSLTEIDEIYYDNAQDHRFLDAALDTTEDGKQVARYLPESLHLMWQRSDEQTPGALPATPESATAESATKEFP